mgnify:CR=1 FL=1|jgi:hypothetical protein
MESVIAIAIILFYIGLFIIITFIISKVHERKQYKLITTVDQSNKYIESFCYKGKSIKLNLIVENATPKYFDTSYNQLRTYTLFVNDNPVVSVWEIDELSKKRAMIFNKNFDTKDLFKILKAYKKEYDKAWDEQYEATNPTSIKNKKAMY